MNGATGYRKKVPVPQSQSQTQPQAQHAPQPQSYTPEHRRYGSLSQSPAPPGKVLLDAYSSPASSPYEERSRYNPVRPPFMPHGTIYQTLTVAK